MKESKFMAAIRNGYVEVGLTAGTLVAGLPPAMLFGFSLAHALEREGWGSYSAWAAGLALAASMEFLGAVSAHVAQHSPRQSTRRQAVAALIMYTLIGIGYMLLFEDNEAIKSAGLISYVVAPLFYWVNGLYGKSLADKQTVNVNNSRSELLEAEEREFKRQRIIANDERKHQIKMSQVVNKSSQVVANSSPNSSTSRHNSSRENDTLQRFDWRDKKPDFRKLSQQDRVKIASLPLVEVQDFYQVNRRLARTWQLKCRQLVDKSSAKSS